MGYNGSSSILQALSKTGVAMQFDAVFSEIFGLLPIVIPVAIGFIAIRKGLSFLFQSLRKA